ncbi:MAG: hypothetical protein HYV07_18810 [Deltaproteobacteria bacterium]|nr:hypothetical protein [Deltaproteobacteria bacterium]
MSLRRYLALVAAIGAVGCTSGTDWLFVPAGDALSLVLVLTRGEQPIRVLAKELGDDIVREPFMEEGELELYALYYSSKLEQLRLPAGDVPMSAGDRGLALPLPIETRRSELRDRSQSSWSVVELPQPIRSLQLDVPVCRQLSFKVVVLPETGGSGVTLGVPLDGERALVATSEGRFFEVSPEGASLTTLSTITPHRAGIRVSPHEVWLAGEGEVWSGDLDRGFAPHSTFPGPPVSVALLAGGPSTDGSFEVFGWLSDGRLMAWRRGSWELAVDLGTSTRGRLHWISPSQLVMTSEPPSRVLRFDAGQLTQIPGGPSEDELTGPDALTHTPDLGTIYSMRGNVGGPLGHRASRLFRVEPDRSVELPRPPLVAVTRLLTGLHGGGLVAGGDNDRAIVQLHPGYGYCAIETTPVRHDLDRAVRLEHNHLLLPTSSPDPSDLELVYMTAR